jgi:hypothetical protein
MASLVRYLDGSYLDAGLYWIKIGDKFVSLPLDTIRTVDGLYTYSSMPSGVSGRLADGSYKLINGGYQVPKIGDDGFPIQNMYTYRIVGEGGGFDLPPGTTKTENGKFKLPDNTIIDGRAVKMSNGSFKLPDGSFMLSSTSSLKISKNLENAATNVEIAKSSDDLAKSTRTRVSDISDDITDSLNNSLIKRNEVDGKVKNADDAVTGKKNLDEGADSQRPKDLDPDADAALKRRIDSLEAVLGIAGLAMLIGGLLMDNGDESERTASDNVKGCVSLCLPHNFSEYYYGRVGYDELKYTTMESAREEFPNLAIYQDQPFCSLENQDCYEHCKAACFNVHQDEQEDDGDGDGDDDDKPWWEKLFPDVDSNILTSVGLAILAVIIIAFLIMIFSLYSS